MWIPICDSLMWWQVDDLIWEQMSESFRVQSSWHSARVTLTGKLVAGAERSLFVRQTLSSIFAPWSGISEKLASSNAACWVRVTTGMKRRTEWKAALPIKVKMSTRVKLPSLSAMNPTAAGVTKTAHTKSSSFWLPSAIWCNKQLVITESIPLTHCES